ncbi:MAG: plasmid mobilization protein [Vampirovibrionales bacterium]
MRSDVQGVSASISEGAFAQETGETRPHTAPKAKRGVGRPRRNQRHEERSSHSFTLRLSPSEMADIETSARLAGLTRSEFIRRRVLGKDIKPLEGAVDYQWLQTLKELKTILKTAPEVSACENTLTLVQDTLKATLQHLASQSKPLI